MQSVPLHFHRLPIPLDRDRFVRDLLRDFVASLEKSVGEAKASDFVSEIGEHTGAQLNTYYRAAAKTLNFRRDEVAAVLVDLKRRIEGDFYIAELTDEKIVLGNRSCPFGAKVVGRHSLCMMTSSVFGKIASENLGYAKVELKETIARRDKECRVVIYLRPTAEAEQAPGREYRRLGDT